MQEWITGQEAMDKFNLTRNELVNLVLQQAVTAYLLDSDRIFDDGEFKKKYNIFCEHDKINKPCSFAYHVKHTSMTTLYFKCADIMPFVYSNEQRWKALLDTKLTNRQRNVVQAVLMKMKEASHKEILAKLFPGQEKPNSVVSQWKEVAENLAAKQNPPLIVPPWES